MKVKFTGRAKMTLEYKGDEVSKITTDVGLEIDNALDYSHYLNKGIPTQVGNKMLTECFIQGLIANVHMGAKMGYVSAGTHLDHIISEFERIRGELQNAKSGKVVKFE